MIYITGDTHGYIDFEKLKAYFSKRYVTKKDYLIILGDSGIFFEDDFDTFDYRLLGLTVFFIDGNHENFHNLNKFPIVQKNNAKMHMITEDIFHILRGEVLIINDLKFLCIGGAHSIDRKYRTLNESFWIEEDITDDDIKNALENVKKYNYKVDYILTHCIDSYTVKNAFRYTTDISTDMLTIIRDKVKYKYWYFGHYHEDCIIDNNKICFFQNVLEIPKMYEGLKNVKSPYYREYKGYLYSSKWGRTKLNEADLPEWFYCGSYGYYYSLKGIVDVAFKPSFFHNHINKDSRIVLSYEKPLNKDENLKMLDDEFDIDTYRVNLYSFVLGIDKYSPNVDTTELKRQINYVCDNYYNDEIYINRSCGRYFKEIDTPIREGTITELIDDGNVVCAFKEITRAKEFSEKYIGKDDILEIINGNELDDYYIKYVSKSGKEIILKKIK